MEKRKKRNTLMQLWFVLNVKEIMRYNILKDRNRVKMNKCPFCGMEFDLWEDNQVHMLSHLK